MGYSCKSRAPASTSPGRASSSNSKENSTKSRLISFVKWVRDGGLLRVVLVGSRGEHERWILIGLLVFVALSKLLGTSLDLI